MLCVVGRGWLIRDCWPFRVLGKSLKWTCGSKGGLGSVGLKIPGMPRHAHGTSRVVQRRVGLDKGWCTIGAGWTVVACLLCGYDMPRGCQRLPDPWSLKLENCWLQDSYQTVPPTMIPLIQHIIFKLFRHS